MQQVDGLALVRLWKGLPVTETSTPNTPTYQEKRNAGYVIIRLASLTELIAEKVKKLNWARKILTNFQPPKEAGADEVTIAQPNAIAHQMLLFLKPSGIKLYERNRLKRWLGIRFRWA